MIIKDRTLAKISPARTLRENKTQDSIKDSSKLNLIISENDLDKTNSVSPITQENKIQDGAKDSNNLSVAIHGSTISTAYDSEAVYSDREDQSNLDVIDCKKSNKEECNQDVPMHTALKEMYDWCAKHENESESKKVADSDDSPEFNDEYGM